MRYHVQLDMIDGISFVGHVRKDRYGRFRDLSESREARATWSTRAAANKIARKFARLASVCDAHVIEEPDAPPPLAIRVAESGDLPEEALAAFRGAFATRGKNAGFLLESAPSPVYGAAWWGWQCILSNVAPVRVNVWSQMAACFLKADGTESKGRPAWYDTLDAWCSRHRMVLDCVAQQPMRFNLTALHVDVDGARKAVETALRQGARFETSGMKHASA